MLPAAAAADLLRTGRALAAGICANVSPATSSSTWAAHTMVRGYTHAAEQLHTQCLHCTIPL
jgi:hypothetical protein